MPLFVLLSTSFWCTVFDLVVACGMMSVDMDVSDSAGDVGDDNDETDDDDDDDVAVAAAAVVPAGVFGFVMAGTVTMPFIAGAECNVPVHLVSRKFGAMSSSSLWPTNELIFALEPISRICLKLA